jgi:hypothetical protein
MPGSGRGRTATDARGLPQDRHVGFEGRPVEGADRLSVFLPCMRPASLVAPGGFIPATGLLGHHAALASGDGSLRSVGGRGGSTRPPVHAGADSPGLRSQQDAPELPVLDGG